MHRQAEGRWVGRLAPELVGELAVSQRQGDECRHACAPSTLAVRLLDAMLGSEGLLRVGQDADHGRLVRDQGAHVVGMRAGTSAR